MLAQVLFTEGQMVTKGQLLAQIDARPFELALMQATGARQRDEAQLQNARLTLERYRTLLQQDSIARQDVDTQEALVKQLEGTVVTDRANEGTARLNLDYTRIVAPVAGRVGLRPVDAGNLVSTSDTTGVAVITQLAPIDVQFTIPQDRVPEVMQRLATGALPARRLRPHAQHAARVRPLRDAGQPGRHHHRHREGARRASPTPTARCSRTSSSTCSSSCARSTDAVVVPVSAVRNGASGDFVYVLNDDKTVSQRNVTRGPATGDRVVIASGLQAGEPVVTEGADRLKDGAAVQLAADVASAPGRAASRPRGGASGPDGASRPRRGERAASAPAP